MTPSQTWKPTVLWFTGLSGSGKTTLALAIKEQLEQLGHPVTHLDGDEVRKQFPQTGFSKSDRDAHVFRVGQLASEEEKKGNLVLVTLISPYEETRQKIRKLCQNFIEVFICTPLAACEKRDPKGLYVKARKQEITHFTGVSDPYQPPKKAELVIDTSQEPLEECVERVLAHLSHLNRQAA